MTQLYFKNSNEWRQWLSEHHNTVNEVWLVFYKRGSDKPCLDYESAVEEALCYGWIDSIIKKIDEEKYLRKFTPRHDKSKWSALNKKRVERLIQNGRMTEIGLSKIKAAKENGMWEKQDRPELTFEMPAVFRAALAEHPTARTFFETLAPTYQKQYLGWIEVAKREETRQKRIQESIQLLEMGERLGLK